MKRKLDRLVNKMGYNRGKRHRTQGQLNKITQRSERRNGDKLFMNEFFKTMEQKKSVENIKQIST